MVRTIQAIYEKGVFRPLESLEGLAERTPVRLRIEATDGGSCHLSDFAGLWTEEDADEIAAIVEAEFETVNPREW